MATTVTSRLFAALAAVFILASCGGGSDVVSPQATVQSAPFVGAAVQGTFDGATRRRALAATSSEVARPKFNVTSRVTTPQAAAVKAQSLAAAGEGNAAPTPDQLFDWAEGRYPDLFPGHQVTRNGEYGGVNYDFRGYPVVGGVNHIGVAKSGPDKGGVYGIGPFTGSVLVRFGRDEDFHCQMDPVICGPKLVSAKIINMVTGASIDAQGATGVAAKGTKLVLTYDSLSCAGVEGTGVVGTLVLTISCAGNAVTFVPGIPGEERWTFGSDVTVTASGLRNAAGYPSAEVSVTFSSQVAAAGQGAKVYTGNWRGSNPNVSLGNAMSIFDVATATLVQQIDYGLAPGYGILDGQVVVDPVAGVVYQAPWSGFMIYRVDLETGSVLTPIRIDPNSTSNQRSRGLVIVGNDVCQVLGVPNFEGQYYYLDNALVCFDRFTLVNTFTSSRGYVADVSMIGMGMTYASGRNAMYVANVSRSAYFEEQTPGGIRNGWHAGTRGTVIEIDAATRAVKRTFVVGSAPTNPIVDEQAGKLYVPNMGDQTISKVDLTTGVVTTSPLGMSGYERPSAVLLDKAASRLYVSDSISSIRVLDLATLQETSRINLGDGDIATGMMIVGGKLWVTSSYGYQKLGDKVIVVNRSTLAVEKKIANRSSISGVENQPYAITAYDPGQ